MTRLFRCRGGCGQLVSPGPRCASCRRAWERAYDRSKPEWHSVYRTAAWRRLSLEVRQAESRCRHCLRPLALKDRIADHLAPLSERPDLAYDRDNLAVACKGCNTKRGRWARVPDPEAKPQQEPARISSTVGERMAAILGAETT